MALSRDQTAASGGPWTLTIFDLIVLVFGVALALSIL